jgi:hypothetical protein
VLDRGESQGFPYIVTDRLAGYVDFREWVTVNSKPSPSRTPTIDEQFFQLFDSAPPSFSTPFPTPGPAAAAAPAPDFNPTPEFMAQPFIPGPASRPSEPTGLLGSSIEVEAFRPRRRFLPTAAKSLLWLVLGVLTALAFLAGLAAFFAFRPH